MSSAKSSSRTNRCLSVVFLIAGLAGLLAARPAAGQGTEGTLPDPISGREVDRYAERLELSDRQRQALQGLHNTYRAEFARLRDGEIETYLKEHGGFGDFRITFDRAAVKDETNKLKKLLDRIRGLDRRFFDDIQPLLSEEQLALLPRLRRMREVQRYRMGLPFLGGVTNPAAQVDLTTIVEQQELSPGQRRIVDARLAGYERQLVNAARALHDVALNRRLIMFDRLEAMGYGPDALANPENAEGMIQAFFSAMNEIQTRLNEEAAEISTLNRRTLKSLAELLPDEQGETLRIGYLRQAYPDFLPMVTPVRRRMEEALRLEDLSEEQRQAIEALRLNYRAARDALLEDRLDVSDAQRAGGIMINPTPEQQAEQDRLGEKYQALGEKSQRLVQQTIDALDRILGRDLAGRVAQRVAEREDAEETQTESRSMMVMTITAGGDEGGVGISTWSSTVTLDETDLEAGPLHALRPLTRRELFRMARRLDLTEDDRAVIGALHEDYLAHFDDAAKPAIDAARAARRKLSASPGADDADGAEQIPTVSDVDRAFTLSRQALNAVQEVDAALFDDIAIVVGDEEQAAGVDRLRLARQRQIYSRALSARGGGVFFGGGGGGGDVSFVSIGGEENDEASVDVADVVDEMDLPDETMTAIDPLLLEYEQQVTGVFRTRYEARQDIDEHMQTMTVRYRRDEARGRSERSVSLDAEQFEAMEARRVEARKAEARIIELNRAARDALAGQLGEPDAPRLRRAYDRRAFASVLRDPGAVAPLLETALAFDDLTADQRRRLTDLAAEYRAAYDECCRKMIELQRGDPAGADSRANPGSDMEAMQRQMREVEKARFERDDLNDRTRAALKVLLTDEQAARLGGRLEAPPQP
ncbi:MAG: hypothetical protein SYC29_03995 [Planctomycetota bacterium]|nr:hypothetical protein [Planctomycetota bacterium]